MVRKCINSVISFVVSTTFLAMSVPLINNDISAEDVFYEFVHPGILNSAEELENMKKYAVSESACEPWVSAFDELEETVESYYDVSSPTYINFDHLGTTSIVRSNSGGWNDMRMSATKVYNLTVAYYITDNEKYAQTARDVMIHYADQFVGIGSKTDGGGLYDINLPSAVIAVKFCSSAEILEYSGFNGWSEADSENLKDMFQRNTGEDTICSIARLLDWTNDDDGLMSQYDMNDLQHGHAAFANAGALAWSVYSEDRDLYERTLANICADADPSYKEAEFSWLRKPVNTGSGGAIAYNINSVTGQNKESDRDMTHSNVEVAEFVTSALIANNQGNNDIFECHDRLLLKGVNFLAQYNLGYDVEYMNEYPWNLFNTTSSTDNRGGCIRKDSMFEAAYNYYKYSSDVSASEMTYLEELVNNTSLSPESISEDVSGMGTLLYSNPDRAEFYAQSADKRSNPEYGIASENYMALVQNASLMKDGRIFIPAGEIGIITYETPEWSSDGYATTQIAIEMATTSKGYVEIRSQSKDGTGYGQITGSNMEAGNTGTLLERFEFENTYGETAKLRGIVLDSEGKHGGTLETNARDMLFIIVYSKDGDVIMGDITYKPKEDCVYPDLFQPHVTPIKGDVNLDGDISVADLVTMQKYLLAVESFSFEQFYKGDINNDSDTDVFDMVLLRKLVVSKQ